MKGKVFCFGEILLRLSPALNREWIHKNSLAVFIGGAELNVATALAKWSVPVKYCTAVPDNYLSREIIEELHLKKIDTSAIHFLGNRIGIFYLPPGADLKSAGVIYDRVGSAFAELKPGIINWDEVLKDCSWFHFSAICPALNENTAAVCKEALVAASAKGITISIDLNYRVRLWKYGKPPAEVMPELVKYCNVIMGNIWSVESLLGIRSALTSSSGKTKKELLDAADKSMLQLHNQFPNATTFAYTFRLENEYWAMLQHGSEKVVSKELRINNVVDKAGSGDCFMGGLIYGMHHRHNIQHIVDFAASAAVGKLQEKGDTTNQSIEQIKTRF